MLLVRGLYSGILIAAIIAPSSWPQSVPERPAPPHPQQSGNAIGVSVAPVSGAQKRPVTSDGFVDSGAVSCFTRWQQLTATGADSTRCAWQTLAHHPGGSARSIALARTRRWRHSVFIQIHYTQTRLKKFVASMDFGYTLPSRVHNLKPGRLLQRPGHPQRPKDYHRRICKSPSAG